MKKARLIEKRMMSVLLAVVLFAAPANMNRCFAEEISEKAKQERLEKQLQEIEKKYAKEEEIGIWEGVACVALACGMLGFVWLANEAAFPDEADAIKKGLGTAGGFVLNGTKTVWNTSKKSLLELCSQETKDNFAFVGAISLVYLPIKLCYSLYNVAKDLF